MLVFFLRVEGSLCDLEEVSKFFFSLRMFVKRVPLIVPLMPLGETATQFTLRLVQSTNKIAKIRENEIIDLQKKLRFHNRRQQ